MTTILYGASDDLIELDGDFYDEYDGQSADVLFHVGNYTLLTRIDFGSEWNIKVIDDEEGVWDYDLFPAGSERAVELSGRDFSDVLVVNEAVHRVIVGRVMEKRK